MIFDYEHFCRAKLRELLKCKCDICSIEFERPKRNFKKNHQPNDHTPCNRNCKNLTYKKRKRKIIKCKNCSKERELILAYISKNNFCSKSCAATYNNKNKTHGTRRSKLECFIEKKLNELYPDLEIHYNQKGAINSELDIYIPSFKLAFELNGIFHYEPIYGEEKLNQITNNDNRKFQACLEKGIELCIIDTSQQSYFSESKSLRYLDIVLKVIDLKMRGR